GTAYVLDADGAGRVRRVEAAATDDRVPALKRVSRVNLDASDPRCGDEQHVLHDPALRLEPQERLVSRSRGRRSPCRAVACQHHTRGRGVSDTTAKQPADRDPVQVRGGLYLFADVTVHVDDGVTAGA